MIKNPNDIVDEMVSDYLKVYGDALRGVVMYGSAVSHDYHPGKSDINLLLILNDNSINELSRSNDVQHRWRRRGVAVPLFMTASYIASSLDTFPVEFLDIQTSYRVLYGDDPLTGIQIQRDHLRLQLERELKGITLKLRSAYAEASGNGKELDGLLDAAMRSLMPLFKGLLVMHGRKIPNLKSEIIAAVEDTYGMGVSVFSEIFTPQGRKKSDYTAIFDRFVKQIDILIGSVDKAANDSGGTR